MDQLATSIRLNIETTKARLLESHDLAEIGQACGSRIEGLRISFPRKLKDLRALAKACGVGLREIVMFEAPLPRKPPAECTGFLATGSASKGGVTINAKVRELDARYIQGITARFRTVLEPAAKTHKGFPANCLPEAYSFVGCKTLGTWGVGMGMNEFGVSVGDHTSFAKDELHPDTGLESNDVCRLVLEGARTAEEGARLVRDLVESHGHSREGQMYFVADPKEAWIVEATSERCAAVRVRDAVAARANGYKISSDWNFATDDLVAYARKSGLWDGNGRFNFARSYSKPFPWASDRRFRFRRVMDLLAQRVADGAFTSVKNGVARVKRGSISLMDGFRIMSDHAAEVGRGKERKVLRGKAITGADVRRDPALEKVRQICSHFRFPSVSAQVAVHDPDLPIEAGCVAWICLGNPCLGVYVPIPAGATKIAAGFADGSVWRKFSDIERASRGRYARVKAIACEVLDEAQEDLVSEQTAVAGEARALLAADKPEACQRLGQRHLRSAFRSVGSAARGVLARLRESGFSAPGATSDRRGSSRAR